MKKIVRLKEADLYNIVRKTIKEMDGDDHDSLDDFFKKLDDILNLYQGINALEFEINDGQDTANTYLKLNIMYGDILYKLSNEIVPNLRRIDTKLSNKTNYYGNLYNKKKN